MRLIDADELEKKMRRTEPPMANLPMLRAMPTIDAAAVVRCKDCQLYSKYGNWCDWHMSIVHDLDFCSLAERRETDGHGKT